MGGLVAALAGLPGSAEQPVHRGHRAQVGALVEQRRPALADGLVDEPATVQLGQYPRTLHHAQTT
jgi:hypothetical protein